MGTWPGVRGFRARVRRVLGEPWVFLAVASGLAAFQVAAMGRRAVGLPLASFGFRMQKCPKML